MSWFLDTLQRPIDKPYDMALTFWSDTDRRTMRVSVIADCPHFQWNTHLQPCSTR